MQKQCANSWCKATFEVTHDDLAFYEKVSPIFDEKKFAIPPPTLCPECRRQRMLAWRNERTLYHRPCNLCNTTIISIHAPDAPYPVYCNPCWRSESWNPLDYGLDYDADRPFLEQYQELFKRVPQRAMVNDDGVKSENCEYCQDVAYSKNCYLVFGTWKIQDSMYCRICDQSKFCVDCEDVKLGSELVYESVDSQRLYHCAYLQNSEGCNNCFLGFDLKGCTDCIACAGLRQKEYHIFNEPFAKEDYEREKTALRLSTVSGIETLRTKFDAWVQKFPRKDMNLQNCEDCLGDHLFHCRDTIGFVVANAEHCRFVERSDAPVHCHDIIQSGGPQWCYACVTVDEGYFTHFSLWCNQSHFTMYSDNCLSCEHVLGCISLRRKKHCILNREYSPEEYERLAASIIERMQSEGVFGEFFPIADSPFGYNETNAAEFFPASEVDVKTLGWHWRNNLPYTTGKETLQQLHMPDDLADVQDTILHEILACGTCGKNYKIVSQELHFYRTMNLPIPQHCPNCRNLHRLARRNPLKLWNRKCAKCQKPISTSYAPERPEVVYCEECYLKEVY